MTSVFSPFTKQTIVGGEYSIRELIEENHNVDKIWNEKSDKLRILFCGTYPIGTTNGYSKITYYLSKYLGEYKDIELSIWGFQRCNQTLGGASIRNDIPSSVKLLDPVQMEKDAKIKGNGFGEKVIGEHLKKNAYDVIIVFNDGMITSAMTAGIINSMNKYRNKFKLVSYMDQVYQYQKPDYINLLNTHYDAIIAFTPYWRTVAYKIGIKNTMPIFVFQHGFDHRIYFPIPKTYARFYYDLPQDAFIICSSNRNQPRKAWDVAIIAWASFVKRHWLANKSKDKVDFKTNKHTCRPIRFMVGTTQEGFWNLLSVLEHECKLIDLDYDYAKETMWFIENPQQIPDRDMNIFMNACDVNFAPVHAEGWGLTCSETLGIGRAQVASYVGGHKEFMHEGIAQLIKPVMRKYGEINSKMKGIGSVDEICLPEDFTDALWKYFTSPDLVEKHGSKGRKHILQNYMWKKVVHDFKTNVLNSDVILGKSTDTINK